jgi:hypothetical protein
MMNAKRDPLPRLVKEDDRGRGAVPMPHREYGEKIAVDRAVDRTSSIFQPGNDRLFSCYATRHPTTSSPVISL